jgi:transcriptional regulator GlxA family with amidase domain
LQTLWNRIGRVSTFAQRVNIVEGWLAERAALVRTQNRMALAVTFIFRQHGAVWIPALAEWNSLGVRQFERRFEREIGTTPKTFARVARFQAAIDAKLANQERTWLSIADAFGYFDQMHMIHDFEKLGRAARHRSFSHKWEMSGRLV